MAAQALTTQHRNAIWAAYGYKCFYCREPLRWDALQVDHVVPEHLAKEPQQRARVFRDLGLPDDWTLTKDHNLVAACDRCNARKRDRIPEPNKSYSGSRKHGIKAPVIALLRERYERQFRGDILRAKLETALAAGYLEEAQVRDLLSTASSVSDGSFRLMTGIEFLDGAQINDLRAGEVELLLDVPVKLGADLPEGLQMEREDSVKLNVRTCREYQHAIANGYYASTTFTMKMEAFFIRTLGVLKALSACRPAAQSYIRDPRLGICDLDRLPAAILPIFGEIAPEVRLQIRTHSTVGSLVAAECAKVLSVSSCEVGISFSNTLIRLREMLWADLDGDGIEDILVSAYIRADGGSLGVGIDPFALALKRPGEKFSMTAITPSPDVQ